MVFFSVLGLFWGEEVVFRIFFFAVHECGRQEKKEIFVAGLSKGPFPEPYSRGGSFFRPLLPAGFPAMIRGKRRNSGDVEIRWEGNRSGGIHVVLPSSPLLSPSVSFIPRSISFHFLNVACFVDNQRNGLLFEVRGFFSSDSHFFCLRKKCESQERIFRFS